MSDEGTGDDDEILCAGCGLNIEAIMHAVLTSTSAYHEGCYYTAVAGRAYAELLDLAPAPLSLPDNQERQ
jgi:hypothetical protein